MELLARAKAHYLAAVSLFMAHNDVRYYLNGISIEPASQGGVLLIATNGHHIGVMHDPRQSDHHQPEQGAGRWPEETQRRHGVHLRTRRGDLRFRLARSR
ncbi:TPA: hypothetical protein N0H42_000458 [Pseudomonas aeruginosa]|uniref:hypothetical protein n=1 Tax=Pseudomonas aeruginosa TaxID=287 RepID=UPI001131049F|nr:hypothetical protein [Pseudomonas aeruginosa]MCV4168545.1 hypothetical protein [Pseudomonas aeruginosa]HCK4895383.1 hypothetical protein [Pseudomonas aeruginosa]HCL4222389.1 hypothetical protein [Pseudomonas aeruginosa]